MEVKRIKRQLSRTINTDSAKSEFIRFTVELEADISTDDDVIFAAHSLHETCREVLKTEVSDFYKRLKENI
jgi:hypothetical protein